MKKSLYITDFDEESKIKFEYLLNNALEIIEIPFIPNNSKLANSIQEQRILQYEAAGIYISDVCDELIALWDEKYIKLKAGTSEIVKYHLSKEKYIMHHLLVSRNNDLTNNMINFKLYEK